LFAALRGDYTGQLNDVYYQRKKVVFNGINGDGYEKTRKRRERSKKAKEMVKRRELGTKFA
jgi:ribosome biogenesis SPOUT family RNA methylase Rps3